MATLDGDTLASEIIDALEAAGKLSTKKRSWTVTVTTPLAETEYVITVKDPNDLWTVELPVLTLAGEDTLAEVGARILAAIDADVTLGTLLDVSHDGNGVLTLTGVSVSVIFEVEVGANLSEVQAADVVDGDSATGALEIQEAIAGAIVDHVLAAKFVGAAPADSDAAGQKGQMFFDDGSDLMYLCVDTDQWVRWSVAHPF